MAEKGDKWLFELFMTQKYREHIKGKIKPFFDQNAIGIRDRRKAILDAYELGIQRKEEKKREEARQARE